ncbi:MAG: acetylxylan esterase [Candidatus Binatia bacterium]
MRTLGLVGALLFAAPSANAAITSVLNGSATCTVQSGANAGERHCSGIFATFDGAPIDVNVGFPPAPATGPDGNFPIIGIFHGWGGSKLSLTSGDMQRYLDAGYAVFSMSDRGWGNSCGATDPKRLQPGVCTNGYNHLMDTRYEVRDAQEVFESLADQIATGAVSNEGLIDPQRIGAMGDSYGGGISMSLGALRDRKMLGAHEGTPNPPNPVPNVDGYLVPWMSPGGKAMRIAATAPNIPWTDLAYSLQPNGHTLDYVDDAPYLQRNRIGVLKQSFVAGLYGTGQAASNYVASGTDPDADLNQWYAAINAGEPYDQDPLSQDIVDELTRHHSSYYIEASTPPAPMVIANGWTDDLFPPDEAIRFYNRTRDHHPGTPIALIFTDHGHQRGQNKGPDTTFRNNQRFAWFEFYVKGTGAQPFVGVQTLTKTCGAPSGGTTGAFADPNTDLPFQATSWVAMTPGEVRIGGAAQQIIAPSVGSDGPVGQSFDPIAGGGACATASAADQTGAATYRSDPAPVGGFTLMGSPTVVADILSAGPTSQVAARLLDVDPSTNLETLVARGLYRPEINTVATCQVFQMHPSGWHFDEGHVAKLELLPADQPYGRNSNGQAPITVANATLRLPVIEAPNGGFIEAPAPKVVPIGYDLAGDVTAGVDAVCVPGSVPTPTPTVTVTATPPPGATTTPTPITTPSPIATVTPAAASCAGSPILGCRPPFVSNKALLQAQNRAVDAKDRLRWSWLNGVETPKSAFGSPTATTSYALCVYDGNSMRLSSATIAAGGTCAGKSCWKEQTHGFRFNDRSLAQGGIQSILLKEGVDGKARIVVKGKGAMLDMPVMPIQTLPITVQLVNGNGQCWEAIYQTTFRNTAEQLKAKAQ